MSPRRGKKVTPIQRRNGQNAVESGREGERVVAELFPHWEYIARPGADFETALYGMDGRPRGRVFIEVKSVFVRREIGRKYELILKIIDKEWANQLADEVVVVTNRRIYFGRAEKLRQFIKEHYAQFHVLHTPKKSQIKRAVVPLKSLVTSKVLTGVNRRQIKGVATVVRRIRQKRVMTEPPPWQGKPWPRPGKVNNEGRQNPRNHKGFLPIRQPPKGGRGR